MPQTIEQEINDLAELIENFRLRKRNLETIITRLKGVQEFADENHIQKLLNTLVNLGNGKDVPNTTHIDLAMKHYQELWKSYDLSLIEYETRAKNLRDRLVSALAIPEEINTSW